MEFVAEYLQDGEWITEVLTAKDKSTLEYNLGRRKNVDKKSVMVTEVYNGDPFHYWQPLLDPKECKSGSLLCQCVCGKFRKVILSTLKSGASKSCGCQRSNLLSQRKQVPTYEYKGKSLTLSQWSRETGIRYQTLLRRVELDWTVEEMLETPVRNYVKGQNDDEYTNSIHHVSNGENNSVP